MEPKIRPGRKLNWAEIIKFNCPESKKILSESLQSKITKTQSHLILGNMKAVCETKPTEISFKNVRRGQLGVVRNALSGFLQSWALLGLNFIGA